MTIDLKTFKKAIKTIQDFDNKIDKITKIAITENVGFVDFHFPVTNMIVTLLESHFNKPEEKWIEHWLYESSKWVGYHNKEYDLTKIEDLYYWLREEYDKVTLWKDEEKKK